jgi:hypothetical protein
MQPILLGLGQKASKQARRSFLKKRTKKLLFFFFEGTHFKNQKFFAPAGWAPLFLNI